jgi:hypothetical protein
MEFDSGECHWNLVLFPNPKTLPSRKEVPEIVQKKLIPGTISNMLEALFQKWISRAIRDSERTRYSAGSMRRMPREVMGASSPHVKNLVLCPRQIQSFKFLPCPA